MKELALEPETVEVLDEIRRPVPGRMPGTQTAAARCVSVKPVVGAYLSGLGLRMVPFCTHINCAPGMAALFARQASCKRSGYSGLRGGPATVCSLSF